MPAADEPDDVLSHLPTGRPARRSARRAPAPEEAGAEPERADGTPSSRSRATGGPKTAGAAGKPTTAGGAARAKTAGAAGRPSTRSAPPPPGEGDGEGVRPVEPPSGTEILHSAARAAIDLAAVGVAIGREAVRAAVSRLPRP